MKTLIQNKTVVNFRRNGSWFAAVALGVVLATLLPPAAFGQFQYQRLKSFGYPERVATAPYSRLLRASDGRFYGIAYGAVFTINQDGSGFRSILRHLEWEPQVTGLVEGNDGALYGTTAAGGNFGIGTVFKLDKDGGNFTVIHSFGVSGNWVPSYIGGAFPQFPDLLEGSDGALYGTTYDGGTNHTSRNGGGTVYRVNKNGSGFTILRHFAGALADGRTPRALLEAGDGMLYGLVYREESVGGTNIFTGWTLFRLHKDGSGFVALHSFPGLDRPDWAAHPLDGYPSESLMEGSDGTLYGTTVLGTNGQGMVFKLNKDGGGFNVLHAFGGPGVDEEGYPAGVTEGSDGVLYGTAFSGGSSGGGVVFTLNKDGSGYRVLRALYPTSISPIAGVVEGDDGALYGTSFAGGWSYEGTIFKLNKDGSDLTRLLSFSSAGGDTRHPRSFLMGSDGLLYGTANGKDVFKLNPASGDYLQFNVAHNFGDRGGHLLEGNDGFLYATEQYGGTNQLGTVLRFNKDGTSLTVLHTNLNAFTEGRWPVGPLVETSDGTLFGTTSSGGNGYGTVFKLNHDGSGYAVVHRFAVKPSDGHWPIGLIAGRDGSLYGTTTGGGLTNYSVGGSGTIFKLNQDGTGFTVLYRFTGPNGDGQWPLAVLLEASDGALYGTTYGGGNGYGTVFKLNKDGTGYAVLHRFRQYDSAANPEFGLVEGKDQLLYGPWSGTVFRLNKNGGGFEVLDNFDLANVGGQPPREALVVGNDGSLYGTTYGGGDLGLGTVFALRPQPTMLPPILSGGGLQVRFTSMPGSTHRLQRASALDGNWLTLTNLIVPTNGVAEFTDFAPPQSSAFYRTVAP